jgi:hypothetical protein
MTRAGSAAVLWNASLGYAAILTGSRQRDRQIIRECSWRLILYIAEVRALVLDRGSTQPSINWRERHLFPPRHPTGVTE